MSFFGDALSFVGSKLAGGAVGYVGGEAAGWALSQIGLGPSDPDAGAIAALGTQLAGVQNSVNALVGKLDAIEATLEEKLREIDREQLYISWELRDSVVQQYVAQIDTQFQRFTEYARNPTTTTPDEVNELVREILNTNNGAGVSLAELKTLVCGSGQDKGVLQLWTEMTIPVVENGSISYGKAIETYINYYTQIAYAQIRAANLIVEAYNAQNNNPLSRQQWMDYRELMVSQEIPFLVNINMLLHAGLNQGATWNVSGSRTNIEYDHFAAGQSLMSGGAMLAHYSPAPEHAAAESILASARAMQPDERRLVIWMVSTEFLVSNAPFSNDWGASQPPLSVYHTFDSISVAIEGPEEVTLSPSHADTVHVFDEENRKQRFRRFVYGGSTASGFVDGTYKMKDQNGQNGLVPNEGSNQETVYFQSDAVLDYTMNVSAAKRFDFMDFEIYADSAPYAAWFVQR